MAVDNWKEALKEAYASAPTGVVILNTLELSHPSLGEKIYIVQDMQPHTMTLEDGVTQQVFSPCPFRFTLPATGQNGLQELNIEVDNVLQEVSDFVDMLGSNPDSVVVKYRAYLNTDLTQPQTDYPLTLYLSDISVTPASVTGRASFANLIDRAFLTRRYTVAMFPGLA